MSTTKHIQKTFFVFLFFGSINTSSAQLTDTINKTDHNFGLSWAIGPQFLLMDNTDMMFGPNMIINSLYHHHFLASLDLHAVVSNHNLDGSEYIVNSIVNASLLTGYRIYINRYSAFQFQAGISYGELWYRGKKYTYSNGWFYTSVTYDREKINYIGFPFKLSYELYHKVVGMEIYISANLHPHYEAAAGVNFLLGRLK